MGNTTTSGRSKDGYVAVEIPGMNYGEKVKPPIRCHFIRLVTGGPFQEESKRLSGLEYGTFKLPLRGETVVTETKCLCNQFDSIDIQSEDAWDLCFIVSINKEPDDEAKSDEELMMDEVGADVSIGFSRHLSMLWSVHCGSSKFASKSLALKWNRIRVCRRTSLSCSFGPRRRFSRYSRLFL